MKHKHTQNEILIRKRKQNAYEVVRFPIIPENEMKKGKLLIPNEYRCTITISMVITYVYAKNSAPRADRGFLNDVQNTNSNYDITM